MAGIDAAGAGDALELEAHADVDALRTDRDAEAAVDAVAGPLHGGGVAGEVDGAAVCLGAATRLAAGRIVADGEGVRVLQHALDAGVGAEVVAELFAEPGEVGEEEGAEEAGEEVDGAAGCAVDDALGMLEVGHGGEADEERCDGEEAPLEELLTDLRCAPRRLREAHAGNAGTLDPGLDAMCELVQEDGLRAGVSAPDATEQGRGESESERADEHAHPDDGCVEGGEDLAEEVDAPFGQVHLQEGVVAEGGPGAGKEEGDEDGSRQLVELLEPAVDAGEEDGRTLAGAVVQHEVLKEARQRL